MPWTEVQRRLIITADSAAGERLGVSHTMILGGYASQPWWRARGMDSSRLSMGVVLSSPQEALAKIPPTSSSFVTIYCLHTEMPSYWETYPAAKYPIEFKLLDDIVHDERYRLYLYPVLERPRQCCLDRDNPNEFKFIPRDFCVLKSPRNASWQTRNAQKKPKLEIFDTDVVQIPAIDPNDRFHSSKRDWSGASYFNRYYHDGLTRVNVETVFRDRLGLSIPLSSESTADQWVPAVIPYNVEIKQNTWEDRLAVIFDGNLKLSQQSMKQRTKEYSQMLKPKVLGRLYLGLWRAKWAEQKEKALFLEGRSDIAKDLVTEPVSVESQAEISSASKGRGRKRRAVLRQLRTGSAPLVMGPT